MTDLTAAEMMERIKRGLAENSARFHPKVIIVEGLSAWGTFRQSLLDTLAELGWVQDDNRWYPPNGVALDSGSDLRTRGQPFLALGRLHKAEELAAVDEPPARQGPCVPPRAIEPRPGFIDGGE